MARLSLGPDTTLVNIYNPTSEDFSCLKADDDNIQHEYIVPSRQIVSFPKYIADHIAKKLAQQIALSGDHELMYDIRYKQALDKIIVTI